MLWRMCNEHYTAARHHETQRATTSQLILAIASVLVAFVGSKYSDPHAAWPASLLVIALGVFGALFSFKQYERFRYHTSAAAAHRREIEKRLGLPLTALRADAEHEHVAAFSRSRHWRLHWFWLGLHGGVAILGTLLLVLVLVR
jgi:hypothetical protein